MNQLIWVVSQDLGDDGQKVVGLFATGKDAVSVVNGKFDSVEIYRDQQGYPESAVVQDFGSYPRYLKFEVFCLDTWLGGII